MIDQVGKAVIALLETTQNSDVALKNVPELGMILVIDDHGLTRQLTVDLLQLEGYRVLEADNGLTALEIAQKETPDLILLDMVMPDMDGMEVCRRLKETPQTAEIPVVFLTVESDRASRLQGLEAGGTDFLNKPLDRLELTTRVKALIQQKRLNDTIHQSKQVLFSIAKAVEGRCCGTTNPSEQLLRLVEGFGQFLSLSKADLQSLKDAAYLHDIGAIAIPDAILLKTDTLTPQERTLLRQHVLVGEQICQPVSEFRQILPIIRHHHERWNGTGYPDGLAGENIPWLAQVFQMADIYDALTSQRPHKQPCSPQTALRILTEEAQQGWRNPELVAQFRNYIQTNIANQ
ncbi:response regulator [Spirulina sp. CS-785/01]|uniref:response regulator n=1 Tax=Spirulina sp. CS-785/01 TaxID=3021716 RepID=UPI0023312AF2|nr:HD domain-containing phosphohydrolase [Spirulina sp. CS-785/01]MDB9314460.1 response regulator [Spirulina sp. CS-785/01]